MNRRFIYPCQESLAREYEARGGTIAVRMTRNGDRRVSLDGSRETNMERAMRKLEAALGHAPRGKPLRHARPTA